MCVVLTRVHVYYSFNVSFLIHNLLFFYLSRAMFSFSSLEALKCNFFQGVLTMGRSYCFVLQHNNQTGGRFLHPRQYFWKDSSYLNGNSGGSFDRGSAGGKRLVLDAFGKTLSFEWKRKALCAFLSKKNKLGKAVICFDVEVDLRILHCCVCTLNLKHLKVDMEYFN